MIYVVIEELIPEAQQHGNEVHEKEIVLKPAKRNSREGWDDAFAEMAENGDDEPVLEDMQDEEDFEWEW